MYASRFRSSIRHLRYALLIAGAAVAFGQNQNTSSITAQAAFEKLKGLAGEWQGTIQEKDNGPVGSASYKVSAGGSVVVETLFPGTEHEMITMYFLDGGQLRLTHYCTAGNQPAMVLDKKSNNGKLIFSFDGGTNMDPKKDGHMHNASFTFSDADNFESEWEFYKEGKKVAAHVFYLSRKK